MKRSHIAMLDHSCSIFFEESFPVLAGNHYIPCSIVLQRSKWKDLDSRRTKENLQVMCKTEAYQDDSPVCLLHDDIPLTMKELGPDKGYDFDFKYGLKSSFDFHEDLAAIDQSMMQMPRLKRRRKVKRRKYPSNFFVPSLEDIKENELFETKPEDDKKDLAAIHRERALSCGVVLKEEGRRSHRKRHSKSKS